MTDPQNDSVGVRRALPKTHHRRSIRLPDYDYTNEGAYYVTICTHRKQLMFGTIDDDEMLLNTWGCIVDMCWQAIPEHFRSVSIDKYVIMPNHVHGIIIINEQQNTNSKTTTSVGAQHAAPLQAAPLRSDVPSENNQPKGATPNNVKSGSLGAIVRSFKSSVTREINRTRRTPAQRVWQRNYYEHIIRDEADYLRIVEYIYYNPAKWSQDDYYSNAQTQRKNNDNT